MNPESILQSNASKTTPTLKANQHATTKDRKMGSCGSKARAKEGFAGGVSIIVGV
jgi:hypothetical protein